MAAQQRIAAQQVEHLALDQFRELAGQAGVAQAAGAVTAGMAQHGDALAAVGIAVAHQGQGLHRHAQSLQGRGQQGTAEVFPVAVAQQ